MVEAKTVVADTKIQPTRLVELEAPLVAPPHAV